MHIGKTMLLGHNLGYGCRFYNRIIQHWKVNELENSVAELVGTYEDCQLLASAIESVANAYQPPPELTDFKRLLEDEFTKRKASSSSDPQNHPMMRQFREVVWNVKNYLVCSGFCSMSKQTAGPTEIEDFTTLDEDD